MKMSKVNYKRLGDYICKVDKRNKDLQVSKLMGLSMSKEFRETTSNIIGTDLSVYKVVEKWQFACDFMSPIRVNKLPIVLKLDDEPIIVSPAYPVFEIIDHNALHPEYLMMWFRRDEFDRFVTFKCDSAIRGGYDWAEMCNTELPVPSIEKQREIVAEYNAVQKRIDLNNQLTQKLEETAQAIYKQWFVDFEFPNEEGKPYKSNGGEMVESELGEIPKGWRVNQFTNVIKLGGGGTPDTTNEIFWNGDIKFFTPADVTNGVYCISTEKHISKLGLEKSSTKYYPENTVFISARGTVGALAIAGCPMAMNQSCYALSGENPYFVHQATFHLIEKLKREASGAVFSALVTKDFEEQKIIYSGGEVEAKYQFTVENIYKHTLNITKENNKLNELQSLLLSKMARVEE